MKRNIILFIAAICAAVTFASMAKADTYVNRATAVADALVDGTATTAQKLEVAEAFVDEYREDIIAAGFNPDTLTNEQKARVFIVKVKDWIRTIVIRNKDTIEAGKVTLEAAEADFITIVETAKTDTAVDWTEETYDGTPIE